MTPDEVGAALKRFGNYRTKRTQTVALEGPPDGISGATMMALGLRESGLRNVNGGAVWKKDDEHPDGHWVQAYDDKGVFMIASLWNAPALRRMLAVKSGTWGPVVPGKTPMDDGHCPRFEESLQFALRELHEAQAFGYDEPDISDDDVPRFSIAAYNAGVGGALDGYREGDVDKFTALGDYSEWVLAHRKPITAWLREHPKWMVTA